MSYTTKEVTEKLNISMHTLRYYEKEGVLPPVIRDEKGRREYSELDIERLILIRCMRAAGMSVAYIKDYINLCMEGHSSVSKRKEIILLQKKILEDQKKELDENLEVIKWKLEYYEKMENSNPEEATNIIEKEHEIVSGKMMKLLNIKKCD